MVNSLRFSGLASGMDTQAIVDSLMRVERLPVDKLYKKQQTIEWKRDDYRSMNLLLKELDDFIFNGIYRKANLVKKSVTSSNTEIVTATANADAANVSFEIRNVKLATAARQMTAGTVTKQEGVKFDPSKSLRSQQAIIASNNESLTEEDINQIMGWKTEEITDTLTVPEESNGEFTLSKKDIKIANGSTITVGNETFTVTTEPKENLGANEVYIDQSTGKIKFGSNFSNVSSGTTFDVKFTNYYLEFDIKTYNDKGEAQYESFRFDGGTSLNQMISKINSSNAGITMFYDEATDRVVAMRKETGEFNPDGDEIAFVHENILGEEVSHPFFTAVLGLEKDEEGTGTNASFTINGLQTERRSNTFTINGVTFTLKKETGADEVATVNINTDVDSIIETITEFVDKYNEVIGKINEKISEERYRDYEPLTQEQKDALSKEEIEKWEEKAKSGLLRRDQLLTSALDRMRSVLYAEVVSNDVTLTNPDFNQLAEIGITTTNRYSDRGKLEIDEDKLREAIEKDAEGVYRLFMADGDDFSEQGLARRLRRTIADTITQIEERAGHTYKTEHSYSMGKELLDIRNQIRSFESRLAQAEQRYWSQFTAMEKAIQELNNQSNMLYSYLGMSMQG